MSRFKKMNLLVWKYVSQCENELFGIVSQLKWSRGWYESKHDFRKLCSLKLYKFKHFEPLKVMMHEWSQPCVCAVAISLPLEQPCYRRERAILSLTDKVNYALLSTYIYTKPLTSKYRLFFIMYFTFILVSLHVW